MPSSSCPVANNTALQLMTDMEAALHGSHLRHVLHPVHATSVCVNVFAIIKYLNELSGNRYRPWKGLTPSKQRSAPFWRGASSPTFGNWFWGWGRSTRDWPRRWAAKWPTWGKSPPTCRSWRCPPALPSPPPLKLFLSHNRLQEEINRRLQSLEVENIRPLPENSEDSSSSSAPKSTVPEGFHQPGLRLPGRSVGPFLRVALRSSAIGEDDPETSFAGQYRSELNVSRENLFTVYKEILASTSPVSAGELPASQGTAG